MPFAAKSPNVLLIHKLLTASTCKTFSFVDCAHLTARRPDAIAMSLTATMVVVPPLLLAMQRWE